MLRAVVKIARGKKRGIRHAIAADASAGVAFRQYKVARRHGSGAGRLEHRHKILTLEAAAKV